MIINAIGYDSVRMIGDNRCKNDGRVWANDNPRTACSCYNNPMKRLLHIRFLWVLVACILLAGCGLRPAGHATPTATAVRAITPPPTATAFIMPTPPPTPTASCAGAPRERLIIGERGRVLPDDPRAVNVRRLPGTENSLVTTIPINAFFMVLDGPVCKDSYSWYQVRYRETVGWLAEGDLTSYYVEPYGTG